MNRPRNRVARFFLDALLIPLAVVIVLVEDVLWAGALALLRGINQLAPVRAAAARAGRLPASVALPLFLIPETLSHLAGAYATLLLAQGRVVASILVAVLVKGTSTLVMVWFYQACSETLLRVAWFARLHHWALAARDWAVRQVAPLRMRLRALLVSVLAPVRALFTPAMARLRGGDTTVRINPRARLRAWRLRLAARLGDWMAQLGRR